MCCYPSLHTHSFPSIQDAIDALNSLQTPFAVLEARKKADIFPSPEGVTVRNMRVYLNRIGYTVTAVLRPLCLFSDELTNHTRPETSIVSTSST